MAFKLLKVALFLKTCFWTIHGFDFFDHGAIWPQVYPECGGRNQSPIDILDKDVTNINDKNLPFQWTLSNQTDSTFISILGMITLLGPPVSRISLMSPNGINTEYVFALLLLSSPSEHKINGISGDLEVMLMQIGRAHV